MGPWPGSLRLRPLLGASALSGGNHLDFLLGSAPIPAPSSHHLWGRGCKLQVALGWEEQLDLGSSVMAGPCQHIVPIATPGLNPALDVEE